MKSSDNATNKRTTGRISEKLYPTDLDHPPRSFWILFSLGDSVRGEDIGKLCNFFLFTTVQDLKFGDISNFNLCLLVLYLLYLIALLHWELVLLLLKVDVNVVPVHYKEWAMYSAVTPPSIMMNFPKNLNFSQNDTSSSFPNTWDLTVWYHGSFEQRITVWPVQDTENSVMTSSTVDRKRRIASIFQHYYPEGGWGVVLLLAVVLVQVIIHGLLLSYGVLLAKVARRFRVSILESGQRQRRQKV